MEKPLSSRGLIPRMPYPVIRNVILLTPFLLSDCSRSWRCRSSCVTCWVCSPSTPSPTSPCSSPGNTGCWLAESRDTELWLVQPAAGALHLLPRGHPRPLPQPRQEDGQGEPQHAAGRRHGELHNTGAKKWLWVLKVFFTPFSQSKFNGTKLWHKFHCNLKRQAHRQWPWFCCLVKE